ncbi:hypothetical protein LZ31DRAFT_551975 [Colletotrichum somersetense]|nr:hypothetical protein LZ31DRAFT_551975 [Colletotrichum somersetense]
MHTSMIISVLVALLAGVVAARRADSAIPATGTVCCNGGTPDFLQFCSAIGPNALW